MLSASHLTRRFDNRVAVEDLSFQVNAGEIFALLGPNGAGKTTTMRMVAGLIAPTSGDVRIDDVELTSQTAGRLRSRVGFLTESPGLWDRLTVFQNLLVHAQLHGVANAQAAVAEALRGFDLAARARDPAAQLSKGLKQRVALARTLLHQPSVVLLDEPTSGLDPESAREVRELILRLRHDGRAIVVSTHNLDEAERVADRVAVLRTRLVALDTPAALRAQVFGSRLRIVLAGSAQSFSASVDGEGVSDVRADGSVLSVAVDDIALRAPGIVRALVRAGAEVQVVVPEQPSLEDVYLRLVRS